MPVITDIHTLQIEILEKPYTEENYRSLLGEIFGTGFDSITRQKTRNTKTLAYTLYK